MLRWRALPQLMKELLLCSCWWHFPTFSSCGIVLLVIHITSPSWIGKDITVHVYTYAACVYHPWCRDRQKCVYILYIVYKYTYIHIQICVYGWACECTPDCTKVSMLWWALLFSFLFFLLVAYSQSTLSFFSFTLAITTPHTHSACLPVYTQNTNDAVFRYCR